MVHLDFKIADAWFDIAAPSIDFPNLTELELRGEVFFGEAIMIVNGADLSWHVDLPMLDFARQLFKASIELSPLEPQTYIDTLDYGDRLFLYLNETDVIWQPSYSASEGICGIGELVRASAVFGVRVFDDFVNVYPEAEASVLLRRWYPINEMKRTSLEFGTQSN